MSFTFKASSYRRARDHVVAQVEVRDEDRLLFSDSVSFTSANSREEFARRLSRRANGTLPPELDVDAQLLELLDQAENVLRDDPAPDAPGEAEGEERIDNYVKRNGRFEWIKVKETHTGVVETRVPLSNFSAKITEDVTVDDGAVSRRKFKTEGELGGRILSPIMVSAEEFSRLEWLFHKWGPTVRLYPGPGQKDRLRDAIQAFSTHIHQRAVFGHAGWQEVDGHQVFLHAGGAIGSAGVVDGVEVELGGSLELYRLPEPPVGQDLQEAVRVSWDIWHVSNSVVIASVLGVVYGAPLSEWLRPDFTLWIRGGTGLLKTSFAALCVSHFGAFDWKSTPAGWESTVNALERQTFIAKDLPLLIDDSRPATDQREAAEKRRKEGRLVRAVGNRSGRERLCADTSFRARYYPRGILLVTAEDGVQGESAAARVWELTFTGQTIDCGRLTEAQNQSSQLTLAGAGYLKWLAGRVQNGGDWLVDLQKQTMAQVQGAGCHLRHAQTLAYLLVAWSVFAEFAQDVGAIEEREARRRLAIVKEALESAAESQMVPINESRPEVIFLETLGELLSSQSIHLS